MWISSFQFIFPLVLWCLLPAPLFIYPFLYFYSEHFPSLCLLWVVSFLTVAFVCPTPITYSFLLLPLLLWCLQFCSTSHFFTFPPLLWCLPSCASFHICFYFLSWWQLHAAATCLSSLPSLRTSHFPHHLLYNNAPTHCLTFFFDWVIFEDGPDGWSWNMVNQLPMYAV